MSHCGKQGHLASVCRQKNTLHAIWPANLDHVFFRQAPRTADHLVAIQTQIDGTGVGDTRWLPDSGADIDAMSARNLAAIDPNLLKNLAPDHHAVHAANSHQLQPLGIIPATKKNLGSNPAVAAALSPWTRLFTPIVPRRSLHISFY